jgi:hypothetical protein
VAAASVMLHLSAMGAETETVPERDREKTPASGPASVSKAKRRREPRWPVAALVGALAVNGLWVALVLWLIAHWVGAA